MRDFFVSYNKHDVKWAEWIAWQLEEEKFSVFLQKWDFSGNWIVAMDRAMVESARTIAVLSPHYLDAVYTHSEWADAFRRDPVGERDILIPVKVAPVTRRGILAQIVNVDLVDVPEDEARRRLIARVRGQRGKPAVAPGFPGSDAPPVVHEAVARRPPYPAAGEDTARMRSARDLFIAFRGQYAVRIAELKQLAKQARAWSRAAPAGFDDAVDRTIVVAAEVAEAMRQLPVSDLEFARAFGLDVHETIFWGQALADAEHQRSQFDAAARAARAALDEERRRHGLGEGESVPDAYGFEMLARVLESALGLLQFDLSRLPLGFLPAPADAPSAAPDLRGLRGLFLARVDAEPGLRLMTVDPRPATIASFTARSLALGVRAARCNTNGALDLVAEDTQHRYYFADSSPVPTAQYEARSRVLDARFVSDSPGGPVALLLSDGSVETLDGSGRREDLRDAVAGFDTDKACLWIDRLDPGLRRIVTIKRYDWDVSSAALDGSEAVTRSGDDLWQQPAFAQAFGGTCHWTGVDLTIAVLQGLDCLLVRATAQWGAVVQFLDPRTLAALRAPLPLHGFADRMTIACGRWLVVAFLQDRSPRRLAVWDLRSADEAPMHVACPDSGDVYQPVVVAEGPSGFRTVQVFRTLNLDPEPNHFALLAFDGPAGGAVPLQRYDRLQLWDVG